jgi:hypothetical protein
MKCRLTIILVSSLVTGCARSPHAGFTEVEEEVHIRLHRLGEGEGSAGDNDSVRVRLRVAQLGEAPGSLFSTERTYGAKDIGRGALVVAMERLHEGDSMSLICPAGKMPWSAMGLIPGSTPTVDGEVRAEFALLEIITPADTRAKQEAQRHTDPTGYEHRLITAWVQEHGQGYLRWGTSDLFFRLQGQASDTLAVRPGEQVTVAYSGTRLEDGVVVDDTERQGGTFTWRYGDPDQVISGLEVAVSLLRVGRSGDFILPAAYAFGERGVPELVEPHSPMHYHVRLIHADRRARE